MNQTQSFPHRDLTDAQHQQIRELLVREAGPEPLLRRLFRLRVVAPVMAVAVVGAVVVGAGAVTQDWNPVTSVPAAVKDLPGLFSDHSQDCGYAERADLSDGNGLRYLASLPADWQYSSWLNREPYCPTEERTEPAVTFVKEGAGRDVAAAVTVWRSLPPGVPSLSADAISTELKPKQAPQPSGASMAVTVHDRPARLIGLNQLTWTEPDGRRWSLTAAGLTPDRLQQIAEGLDLGGGVVRWPTKQQPGYRDYPLETRPQPKEYSPQYTWYLCASNDNESDCRLSVTITRPVLPWQAELSIKTLPARMVEINGRPGVLKADPDIAGVARLTTNTADGAQVEVEGAVPPQFTVVTVAEQLRAVAADDPAIREPGH